MKKRVLVLTDFSTHSDQNSIYALLRELLQHEQCEKLYVASRGSDLNDGFFFGMRSDSLFAMEITRDFEYVRNADTHYNFSVTIDPSAIDILFLRLPRPISDDYLLWVETTFTHSVIINSPSGIIKTSNKEFLLSFPELMPPTRLCKSIDEIKEFADDHAIVLKPLREYGGRGILKVDSECVNDGSRNHPRDQYLKSLQSILEKEGYLAMKYLKNVSKGDKRILVVGDKILAASLRLPADGSWLCNVAQGGASVRSEVSTEEIDIVSKIAQPLKDNGILFYGVDTLEDDDGKRVLSEINTLSIGGFPQAEAQTGQPIIKQAIQELFNYVNDRSN